MGYSTTPHGLMFHHFHGAGHAPCQGSISARELERLILWVGVERILPAAEWRARSVGGALRPGDLCLSLDDSLKCQIDVALPVFQKYNLTAFWFIYTSVVTGGIEMLEIYRYFRHEFFNDLDSFYANFIDDLLTSCDSHEVEQALAVFRPDTYMTAFPFLSPGDKVFRYLRDDVLGPERYHRTMAGMMARHGAEPAAIAPGLWMGADDVRALSDSGHVIGLHSHSHPTRFAELPPDRQRDEYRRNADALREITGLCPDTVGHPCGSYDGGTLRLLAEMGVVMGFRANMARTDHGPLEMPREDHANIMRLIRTEAADPSR